MIIDRRNTINSEQRRTLRRKGVPREKVGEFVDRLTQLAERRGVAPIDMKHYLSGEIWGLFKVHPPMLASEAAERIHNHFYGDRPHVKGIDMIASKPRGEVTITPPGESGLPPAGSPIRLHVEPESKKPLQLESPEGLYGVDMTKPLELTLMVDWKDKLPWARIRFHNGHEIMVSPSRLPTVAASII
jgi:hypothetical protein